jgi:acetyl esterase/lipase
MPVGYLVTVVLIALCTAVALRPVRRPRLLAGLSYYPSLVVTELPQLPIVLLAPATALAVAQNDLLGSASGWLLLALVAVTVAGLAVVARRGAQAEQTVRRAVADLGGSAAITPPTRRRRLRILLTPFPVRDGAVERVADISYGPDRRYHRLDVYRHRSHPTGRPVLVYLHGGGYVGGDKHREAKALLLRLARHGWVCVSANYRLRPAEFPDQLVDAKSVIAWTREHGHEFGADPTSVFVGGSSAGAHLASLAALTPNEPALQPGFEHVDTKVTAAICLYGWYGRFYGRPADESPVSSPTACDPSTAPPFFLAHGDHDTSVPVDGARRLVAHLRGGSPNPVVYAELRGAQHAFDAYRSLRFEAVVDGIEAFAAWVMTRQPESGRPSAPAGERIE